jgi:hypothetical protein
MRRKNPNDVPVPTLVHPQIITLPPQRHGAHLSRADTDAGRHSALRARDRVTNLFPRSREMLLESPIITRCTIRADDAHQIPDTALHLHIIERLRISRRE